MNSIKVLVCVCLCIIASTLLSPQDAEAQMKTVEETVREYFKDTPVMIEIARCESKFRQFNADGTPLRGGWGGQMVGVFQFFESVHASGALKLGFDITTLEGNLGYAKHVHAQQGTTPWNSAKACWGSAVASVKAPPNTKDVAELRAKIKTLQKLVAQLQELLEKKRKLSVR